MFDNFLLLYILFIEINLINNAILRHYTGCVSVNTKHFSTTQMVLAFLLQFGVMKILSTRSKQSLIKIVFWNKIPFLLIYFILHPFLIQLINPFKNQYFKSNFSQKSLFHQIS